MVYLFASDEARSTFLVEPFNFVNNIRIPPLRLVFLGPEGSGKTTYIKQANIHGPIHVNFSEYILEFADRQSTPLKEEILQMINNTGKLSQAIICEVLGSLYRTEVSLLSKFSRTLQKDLFWKSSPRLVMMLTQ